MRIRHKPWAKPELAACDFFIDNPKEIKGNWSAQFTDPGKLLHLEVGCGKGGFMAQISPDNTDINYLAIDIKSEMLGLCKRKVEAAYKEKGLPTDNVRLAAYNVSNISDILGDEDCVERMYINFCNPWPKAKHQKRRLTHPRLLSQYRAFLADSGEIWFKTDDRPLFEDSLEYFAGCGFAVRYQTDDLHASGFQPNYRTEHEIMFTEMGKKINFLIAVKQ